MAGKVQLITVDIGRTLGVFTRQSTTDQLRELSPIVNVAPHRSSRLCGVCCIWRRS